MQKLFYNYIFKPVIIIVTISAFLPLAAFAIDAKDQKFEGYQVKFDYEGYPEEREIAYQYYLDEESKYMPGIEKKNIGIDLYDDGGEACPRAGCPFAILRIVSYNEGRKSYKKVPSGTESGASGAIHKQDAPKILKSSNFGYHDIIFGEWEAGASVSRWNGKYYDIGEILQ